MLHRQIWLGGATAVGALLLTAGTPVRALGSLTTSLPEPHGADPFAPVIAVVALTAWLVLGYLGVVSGVLLLARLPGAAGSVFRGAGRLLAPAVLRRALELALGLSVVAGGLGMSAATAHATSDNPGAGIMQEAELPDLDWPSTPDRVEAVLSTPASPVTTRPRAATTPEGTTSGGGKASSVRPVDIVVVRPGDTLWDLASHSLRAAGEPRPTATRIAQTWPQWWSANRAVIGAHPDLLVPGTALTPPT